MNFPKHRKFPVKMSLLYMEESYPHLQGSMTELAYAAVSKSAVGVRVRSPLLLPISFRLLIKLALSVGDLSIPLEWIM